MSGRGRGRGRATPAPPAIPLGHGDLRESLLFVFPLFLAYGVGLLFARSVNGVDFVSRLLFAAVGHDRTRYLAVHLVLAAGFLAIVLYLRRARAFRIRAVLPVVLEAAIYALTLGSFILFAMERVFGSLLALPLPSEVPALALPPFGEHLVLAMGAGVHEELVFRLGLLSGGAFVLERVGARRGLAVLVAALASSLLFAAAHHIGPYGEPWDLHVVVYRALAGGAFATIYWYRSLAHAVYAHFLYDVYVLLVR